MSRRPASATESLLKIALGIDLILIFFGTLVIRGLDRFDEAVVWSVGGVAFAVVIGLFGVIRFRWGQWLGHVVHAAMLSGFAIDLVVGLSIAVPVGFWVFGAVRGRQLDNLGPPPPTPASP
jgi:hypothetical protein